MSDKPLRFGVFSEGGLSGALSQSHSVGLVVDTETIIQFELRKGGSLSVTIIAEAFPWSPAYDSASFGAFTEAELFTLLEVGAVAGPIFVGNDRELSPVTYEVLDDLTLTYSAGRLVSVTFESGGQVALSYGATGQLESVLDTRTGTRKTLTYASGRLSKVTTTKTN